MAARRRKAAPRRRRTHLEVLEEKWAVIRERIDDLGGELNAVEEEIEAENAKYAERAMKRGAYTEEHLAPPGHLGPEQLEAHERAVRRGGLDPEQEPAQLWIWYWHDGGYNSHRGTRAEAIMAAAEMGAPERLRSGQTTDALIMDEDSLHVGSSEELAKLDRMYSGD